eukprot:TRINITY_DN6086_c4_g1_i1.p1 TRINITY_DN6086_c4_g1~~TRINITY_DN6086_c4_g1_i1.p1  ORF type:complete len:825 (+),score=186.04 TRINITY_DN6086_c4_g1_i1:193-2667(+)
MMTFTRRCPSVCFVAFVLLVASGSWQCGVGVHARGVTNNGTTAATNSTADVAAIDREWPVSTECQIVMDNITSYPNSSQMLMNSGILPGEMGDYWQCQQIEDAHHCLVTAHENQCSSTVAQCNVGLCFPIVCSPSDVVSYIHRFVIESTASVHNAMSMINAAAMLGLISKETAAELAANDPAAAMQAINSTVATAKLSATCGNGMVELDTWAYIILGLIAGLTTMVIIGTLSTCLFGTGTAQQTPDKVFRGNEFHELDEMRTSGGHAKSPHDNDTHDDDGDDDGDGDDATKAEPFGDSSLDGDEHDDDDNIGATAVDMNINVFDTPSTSSRPRGSGFQHTPPSASSTSSSNGFVRFLNCFCVFTNVRSLFTPIPGSMGALNGIRVLSMLWVILGHTYVFMIGFNALGIDNLTYMFMDVAQRFSFQFVLNALFAVDVFFAISGFLVGYFLLREMRKDRGRGDGSGGYSIKDFILYVIHRLARLLPLYAFTLLVYTRLSYYIGSGGPYWHSYREMIMSSWDHCWVNFVFLNNIIYSDFAEQCMPWTWFLANDMQFYLVSPLFVYAFYRSQVVGWVLLLAALGANLGVMGWLQHEHDYVASILAGGLEGDYFADFYQKPWVRIGPYLIGMAAAFIYSSLRGEGGKPGGYQQQVDVDISIRRDDDRNNDSEPADTGRACLSFVWHIGVAMSLAIMAGLVFITYRSENWSALENFGFVTFSRAAFSVALVFVVIACLRDHGGPVNDFLSAATFSPLAKLTYGAYLIHPCVMMVFYFSEDTFVHYRDLDLAYLFLGHTAFSYAGAALCYVLVEKPFANVEKLIMTAVLQK